MKRLATAPIKRDRAPANLAAGSLTTLTDVGPLNLPGTSSNATGADMSRDGRTIVLRTYSKVLVYNVPTGATIQSALTISPCTANAALEPQGEAVAIHPDDLGFVTLSEGSGQALHQRDV
jgi:hypothetical protein